MDESILAKLLCNKDLLTKILTCDGREASVATIAFEIVRDRFYATFDKNPRTKRTKTVWYTLMGSKWVRDDKTRMLRYELSTTVYDYFEAAIQLLTDENKKIQSGQSRDHEWIPIPSDDIPGIISHLTKIAHKVSLPWRP